MKYILVKESVLACYLDQSCGDAPASVDSKEDALRKIVPDESPEVYLLFQPIAAIRSPVFKYALVSHGLEIEDYVKPPAKPRAKKSKK